MTIFGRLRSNGMAVGRGPKIWSVSQPSRVGETCTSQRGLPSWIWSF